MIPVASVVGDLPPRMIYVVTVVADPPVGRMYCTEDRHTAEEHFEDLREELDLTLNVRSVRSHALTHIKSAGVPGDFSGAAPRIELHGIIPLSASA